MLKAILNKLFCRSKKLYDSFNEITFYAMNLAAFGATSFANINREFNQLDYFVVKSLVVADVLILENKHLNFII